MKKCNGKSKKIFALCMALCMGILVFMELFTRISGGDMVYAMNVDRPYQIRVNRAANCVTVYERDENGEYTIPIRAFACSSGRQGHETPLGRFKTSDYYKWRLMVDGTYGQYAVRFNGNILFHSVPYYSRSGGDLEWEQYNLLGEAASLGCVRLTCADAKWIYDNCKFGTEVIVYDDEIFPGPLGKPTEAKVAATNPWKTWDPTDISINNPWRQIKPSLYLVNDWGNGILYLPTGATKKDIKQAVGMKDVEGNTYKTDEYNVVIYGKYNINKEGVYNVSVRGISKLGIRVEQEMILCIVDV